MQTFFSVLLLIIGLVIGTRIGLRGLFMFWVVIGLIYGLIKIPLVIHGFVVERTAGTTGSQVAGIMVLVMSIVLLLWGIIQLGAILYENLDLDILPEGIDRAFGGALGGALGWIIATILI